MSRPVLLALLAATAAPSFALDDFPVFLDAGCDSGKTTGKLGNGYAQGPSDMLFGKKTNGDKTIPVTCEEKLSGSDAIVVKLARTLAGNEYWDYDVKFADDRKWSMNRYTDVRLWIKNKAATATRIRVGMNSAGQGGNIMDTLSILVGTDWKEYIVPVAKFEGDSAFGIKLSHMPGTSVDLLVDSIRLTDGTGLHPLDIPNIVHNPVPGNWGPNFLLGSFDNRELGKSTKAQQAGLPYRYQYVMPDIKTYYSRSGNGYVYDYAMFSDTLGVKTAIVWYNLGKVGEGWDPVTKNLADATYMGNYFDRYDWVLDQLAMAGQSDYMIVVEPDMYGFLMRGPGGSTGTPIDDPTRIAVAMGKANSLSGKTWEPNMVGWAKYIMARAKEKLPKGVILGHMPNHWGVSIPGQVGQGRKESHIISGSTIGRFLSGFGKEGMGDVVFVEKSDHDAGHKPSNENWFWDSTSYSKFFLWTRAIASKTGLPICGWQVSEGNLTNTNKLLRDDAAQTFIAHPEWWIDGGFTGILFGAGNADCANYLNDNDSGWFVKNLTQASKTAIPLPKAGVSVRANRSAGAIPTISTLADGIRFDGFQGAAKATVLDARGRQLATFSVTSGQFLSRRSLPAGFCLVKLATATRTTTTAILP